MISSSQLRQLALGLSAITFLAGAAPGDAGPQDAGPSNAGKDAINGRPQILARHHPTHPAPASLLPDTGPMPNASAALASQYGGTPIDVLTYHYDNARTGWNQSETDLTQATVASANFGLLKTLAVDGNVLAQPLEVSNIEMADRKTHNVLIVATGHNSIYAYDSDNYDLLWHTSLGPSQSSDDVGCGDVVPEYGISSTPVIVRSGSTVRIYVVAATEPSAYSFHTELHMVNLINGKDLDSVEIAPTATLSDNSTAAFDPQNQWSRAGLAISNGNIYIGISSHCDNNSGAITGWMLQYGTGLKFHNSFHTVETPTGGTELASIWMTGFAPAVSSVGNLFFATGNGDYAGNGANDWGESVVSLFGNLGSVRTSFTAANYASMNNGDQDLGSGGVMLIPNASPPSGPPLAVITGKTGILYLLNQNNLGGLRANDAGAVQTVSVGGGLWGGPAFYQSQSGPLVFVQTDSGVLNSFLLTRGTKPSLTQFAAGTTYAGYGGSLPIVSSNGNTAGTGVVWLIRRSSPMELEAYNADSLGAPIFAANAGVWSNMNNQNPFVTPMVANGRVYAPAYQTVKVFGLTPAQ